MIRMLALIAALTSSQAIAAPTSLDNVSLEKLEAVYWDCEHAASQGMLPLSTAAECSMVFEKLKERKFKGDFKEFMAWWQVNKGAQQQARAKK
jgi:hypothetical protein